jgi:hypothetical protein
LGYGLRRARARILKLLRKSCKKFPKVGYCFRHGGSQVGAISPGYPG